MVEEFDVVDFAGVTPDGRTGLMMFEHRDWTDTERQVSDLKKKVQAYFSYVVDGDMARGNPNFAQRPVWFRLVCQVVPPQRVRGVLTDIRSALEGHGIEFQLATYDPTTKTNTLIPVAWDA